MASVFIKVPVSERLPKESGDYYSNIGRVYFKVNKFYLRDEQVITKTSSVVWWLEEIELPTEEETCQGIDARYREWQDSGLISNISESAAYKAGLVDTLNFILDKLKGGNK